MYNNLKKNAWDMTVIEFFALYLKKYSEACHDFVKFYRKYSQDIGIEDFTQKSFILMIP